MTRRPGSPSLRYTARTLVREALLDAAENEFAENGFERARIQDIAKRARVAVGTIYNHFREKHQLLVALMEERGQQIASEFLPRSGDPRPYELRFRARFRRVFGFVAAHRSLFTVAAEQGLFREEEPATPGGRFDQLVRQLLEEGIQGRILRREDPIRYFRFLGGAMRSVMNGAVSDPTVDLAAEGDFVLDMFLSAALRRPRRSREV